MIALAAVAGACAAYGLYRLVRAVLRIPYV